MDPTVTVPTAEIKRLCSLARERQPWGLRFRRQVMAASDHINNLEAGVAVSGNTMQLTEAQLKYIANLADAPWRRHLYPEDYRVVPARTIERLLRAVKIQCPWMKIDRPNTARARAFIDSIERHRCGEDYWLTRAQIQYLYGLAKQQLQTFSPPDLT